MQDMVVVGLIVKELSNIVNLSNIGQGLGQGTCQACAMRRRTMQGLVVVGLVL